MPKRRGGGGGGEAPGAGPLRLAAWALGLLAIGSAFAPLPRDFLRTLHWVLCLFSILEGGIAIGQGRKLAFFLDAAVAVLVNPFRPFLFALQVWRMIHAAVGIWLIADHLPRRG